MMTVNTPITSGQRRQIVRFFGDGLDALDLTKDGAQRVIEEGGNLQERTKQVVRELAASNSYANEEVPSNYGYPIAYAVKPLMEQIDALKRAFTELRTASAIAFVQEALPELTLPEGAEGWFAIPRWDKIAPTYGKAVEQVLEIIASTRKFYNYREGKLGPEYLRQSEQAIAAWKEISTTQRGDILIVPAQFGKRHAGRSVRRAREVFAGNEFGLGAFAVTCMLLTHPERLVSYDDLWIDCAGDEYSPDADDQFDEAPYFDFYGGRVRFGTRWVDYASESGGSDSAFLPQ